jgi:outer membrane receptor for ferrienterochelin and colicin
MFPSLNHKNLMIRIKIISALIVLGFITPIMQAQLTGRIQGIILDEQTGKGLYGANILVQGTLLGAASDETGGFTISRLPPGAFTLFVTMIGYESQSIPITVQPDVTRTVTIHLTPTILKQPTLVVTATKRRQLIEDAPTTVDILQGEDILKRNPTTLDQVLVNTAGLGIIDGQIELRGSTGFNWAAGSRVLLMLDGHPMINGDTGGIFWEGIPIEEIERVEIVKGAGSALYGSNAMAGMVNIITRSPAPKPRLRYHLNWGFYDEPAYENWRWTDRFLTYRIGELKDYQLNQSLSFEGIDLSYSQKLNQTDLVATLGHKRSSGYHENGSYSRWNGMVKTSLNFTAQKKWSLLMNYSENDHAEFLQWQSQSSPLTVPDNERGNRILYKNGSILSTFSNAVNHQLAYQIKVNWNRTDWKNNFSDTSFPDTSDFAVTDRLGSEIQVDLLRGNHGFTFGTEGIYITTRARIFGNRDSRDAAVYAEDEIKITPLWTGTIGTRIDIHHIPDLSTDWQISPRAGLVYRPFIGTSLRLSAGRGFRAPSLAEVFSTVNVAGVRVVPNLELTKAERALSAEIGFNQIARFSQTASAIIRWFNPKLIFDAALFANQYTNMIDIDYNESLKAFQFMSLGRARTWGTEAKIQLSLIDGACLVHTGYTWLHHEDVETGKPLPYRSDHRIVTGAELKWKALLFGLDYRYASRQREVVTLFINDERVPMHVIDARIQIHWHKMSFSVEGKNLRNYHYTLRQRFLEPVRHYLFTWRGEI